jgi:tryptophanyl-tRNA synthetase
MTSINDKVKLEENTREAFIDLLALGIDPDQSTFWVQSHVPEVTELAWILSNFASVGLMQRSTSYKDKIANGLKPNMGLFSYPILMASDILLFQSEIVPVGKDQKQHLEMTRDIAIKFNNSFGEIFTIPEIEIDKSNEVVVGVDNQKMSKSYNNTIPIFADNDTMKNQVMNIVTDSAGLNEPKDKNTPLFKIYSLFLNDESKKELAERYDTPGLKYMDIKNELIETIISFFELQRSKREQLLANPDEVNQKMILGQNKAKKIAQKTLQEVKSATGLL